MMQQRSTNAMMLLVFSVLAFFPSPSGAAAFQSTVSQLSAGSITACAINGGNITCWGNSGFGQGNVPTLPSNVKFSSVSVGAYHVCAITTRQNLRCWGTSFNGYGYTDVPTLAPGITWRNVSSSWDNTCGVTSDSNVICFGREDEGVNKVPKRKSGAPFAWSSVSTGNGHACGVTMDGRINCWGLLTEKKAFRKSVLTVPALPLDTKWVAVDVSDSNQATCGLTDKNDILCWGPTNNFGQNDVPSGHVWTAVAAGIDHVCGMTVDASIICWGLDWYGLKTVPELPPFSRKWVSISLARFYSCALSDAGAVRCWGDNEDGTCDVPTSPPPSCRVNADCTTSYCFNRKCAVKP